MYGLRTEPAAVTFAIRACLYALIAFQVIAWTDTQIVSLLAAVDAVLTMFVRNNSTSRATLTNAGTSQETVAALASTRTGPPSFNSRL